ncbi:unnamed protein product [Nippostrongylus brasiliensis]|uniref:Uncharacterized protein n=1 Tax=Nippostrongylus brasiliensis TaxID=27835 RepID=A0A0N4YT85_NIPBR|nr:unnamed protein product [Nippostrongylus brasiliensis]
MCSKRRQTVGHSITSKASVTTPKRTLRQAKLAQPINIFNTIRLRDCPVGLLSDCTITRLLVKSSSHQGSRESRISRHELLSM